MEDLTYGISFYKILLNFSWFPIRIGDSYVSMTPTRTVQAFIDAKKENKTPSNEILNSLRGYRSWNEPDLIGLRNASAYFPDIYFEPGMDETISLCLQKFKNRIVPHKF
jgi:hypothetical protein